jgi:hypothetical protein
VPLTGQLGTANSFLANIELAGTTATTSPPAVPTPEVKAGPPILGAPWAQFRIEVLPQAVPPPAAATITASPGMPEVHAGPPLRGAPWFQPPIDTAPPASPAPKVIPATAGTPEIKSGPAIYGAPWTLQTPLVAAPFHAAPPLPPVQTGISPTPEVRAGPPMVGSPWVQFVPITSNPLPNAGVGGAPAPPPPPHPEFPSHQRPFIARVPDAPDRLRRFTETLTNITNSLLGKGQIQQDSAAQYEIIGGGFRAFRNPGATDDVGIGATPGCTWVNQATNTAFVCIQNTALSAIWTQAGAGGGGGGSGGLTGTFP